jgi:REP element-mobilizing transposase RayT
MQENVHSSDMPDHRRQLPHLEQIGRPMFVTFRLAGSLPPGRSFPDGSASGQQFVAMDRMLDTCRSGPVYLGRPEVAQIIISAIDDDHGDWETHAFVIMPNHVHLLLTPRVELREVMQRIKGVSARYANKLLNLTGQQFWQRESFDRLVRDREEFERIRRYIVLNPVRAGLVSDSSEFVFLRS